MLWALVTRNYSFHNVFAHVDNGLELAYVVTAFWAGSEGSLLFWELCMALCGAVFAFTPGYRALSERTRAFFWVFFFVVNGFFLLMLTCWVNPFMQAVPTPPDGRGMNPLLRNPGMIFHPPLLLRGYAMYVIPGCAALAGALSGQTREWITATRNWNILSWTFLSAGIILGGWWSYMELGWGGYWAWDPVENASLIPWCTGTAFLHTAIVGARRNALARTNIVIMAVTYALCVFGTYLVRSGVVESLHAFGEGGVAAPLLSFILFLTGVSFAAAWVARPGEQRPLGDLVSREGLLLIVAWVLIALGAIIGLGTMWPVVSKLWSAKPVGLDAGFYNRVCLPLFAVLVLLFSACPWLGWKQCLRDRRGLLVAAAAFVVSGGAFLALGYRLPLALVGAAAAVSCMVTALLAVGLLPEARTRKSLAAYVVHLGLGLMALGVAFPVRTAHRGERSSGREFSGGGLHRDPEGRAREKLSAHGPAHRRDGGEPERRGRGRCAARTAHVPGLRPGLCRGVGHSRPGGRDFRRAAWRGAERLDHREGEREPTGELDMDRRGDLLRGAAFPAALPQGRRRGVGPCPGPGNTMRAMGRAGTRAAARAAARAALRRLRRAAWASSSARAWCCAT